MEFRSLKFFLDAMNAGSLTKAADQNFVTPSAVSQQLKALEREVGAKLFFREQGGLVITDAGKVVADHAREILNHVERINSDVKALEGKVSGNLRVGAIYSVGLYFLSKFVSEFIRSFPDANLDIAYLRNVDITQSVIAGHLDLGVVAYPPMIEGLTVIPIIEEPIVLIVPPEHRFASWKTCNPADLANEPFIAFQARKPSAIAIKRYLNSEMVQVRVIHEFDNIDMIKRAVEVGAGIALVPLLTVERECERGDLVAIPFAGNSLIRPVAFIHRRPLNTAAKAFVGLLTGKDLKPKRQKKPPVENGKPSPAGRRNG